MAREKILVTAATGKIGGSLSRKLLESGWPVRALVRSRDARSTELERAGAEVIVADIFDAGEIRAAMRGVRRAYYGSFS